MYSTELLEENDWNIDFRKEKLENFNLLPMPVWKRIKLDGLKLPEYRQYREDFIRNPSLNEEKVEVFDIRKGLEKAEEFKGYFNVKESFGVGEKFVTLGEALYNSGVVVRVKRNSKAIEPIGINFRLDSENPLAIDHNLIIAEENSVVNIIFDYSSFADGEAEILHNGVTKVYAKHGAEVNIVKVQRMNKRAYNFDSNVAFLEGDARVNWISVEIGAALSATSFVNNLEGTSSEADLRSVYLGDGDTRLDLGYTMNHIGMRSKSNIETRGALKDRAKKVFRGNLDFKKGARRSKGEEAEYVLLLDPTVKSDAIPVLFCAEDDVEGNHAASAGQIDGDKLFYLMSRGFEEREAKKLIVEASFRPILDRIPSEELRVSIEEEIHRRLVYA